MIESHQDLTVWQRAMELARETYQVTRTFPSEERFGLISQMRRAAVSIPSNIAEGWGRQTTNQYIQFLQVAQGSASELETQLILAVDLQFLNPRTAHKAQTQIKEIRKMLRSLIGSLQRKNSG